jgi:hypothetical protein
MRNEQFTLRPTFRRPGFVNLPECSAHEIYSKLKRFLIDPAAPRVLQDDELNQIMYSECWGLGGGVVYDQATGLELRNGILTCNGRLD